MDGRTHNSIPRALVRAKKKHQDKGASSSWQQQNVKTDFSQLSRASCGDGM